MVEPCILLTTLEGVKNRWKPDDKYQRLYFGNEFCEYNLPSTASIGRILELGAAASFVTPLVTGHGIKRIEEIIRVLGEHPGSHEVIANDFGVLEMLAGRDNLVPVLGRLLTRNVFDIAHGRLVAMSSEPITLFRERYGATRYEISSFHTRLAPPEEGMPEDVRLSLHYPYMYLATTRRCAFRFQDVPKLAKATGQQVFEYQGVPQIAEVDRLGCDRSCRKHMFQLRYPNYQKEPFYLKGNTLFSCFDDFPFGAEDLARLKIDRVVFSPELPV